MSSRGPGKPIPLPLVYSDGFETTALLQSIITAQKKVALANSSRFWATPERASNDGTREILDITLSGARLINYISFETAHFPHQVSAEYHDDNVGGWHPFVESHLVHRGPQDRSGIFNKNAQDIEIGSVPVSAIVADSIPPRVNPLADSSLGFGHPQHNGAGHWMQVSWRVRPVQVTRMRLVLTRNPAGYPPADSLGNQVGYSLGIRSLQPGYRINSKSDIPRFGDVDTHTSTFASSNDLLGSRVVYSLMEQKPNSVTDGLDATAWKSEPQPVNYAVVNFYADTRDQTGVGQTIDRFFLDPTHVGAHMNLYYSNSEPSTSFEASDEPLTYPISQRFGDSATPHQEPNRTDITMVSYSMTNPAFTDISNAFLQFDPSKPWWLGSAQKASAGLTGTVNDNGVGPTDRPWYSFGGNTVHQSVDQLQFSTENGETVSFQLPATHAPGVEFSYVIEYNPTGGLRGDPTITITYRIGPDGPLLTLVGQIQPLKTRPQTFSLGRFNDFTNPGVGALQVRGMILKPVATVDGEIAAFTADGYQFVNKDSFGLSDDASTDNAMLRLHPMFSVPTTNPEGLVGGPGDKYEDMSWTPIFHDYTLRRGFLEFPPTKAKYWKFEFTKLVPETYESFVPILRRVKLFPVEVVSRFAQTGGIGPFDHKSGGYGFKTMMDLTHLGQYENALAVLQASSPHSATHALYSSNLTQAQRLAKSGWIWSFQPWHMGSSAPRFVDQGVHRYSIVSVEHRTKIAYFAGLKTLQAFRVNYLADDDTPRYIEHFLDTRHVATVNGFTVNDGQLLSNSSAAEIVSQVLPSQRPVRAVQFATIQSNAVEVLPDDGFLSDSLTDHWSVYGDALLSRNPVTHEVLINRGWHVRTYGTLEGGSEITYAGSYSNIEGHLYGEVEGGQPNGLAGGGISSEPILASGSGRIYGALKVTAQDTLSAPVILQIVSVQGNVVLASTQRTLRAGETQTMWVGYTPGSVTRPLRYADLDYTSQVDALTLAAAGATMSQPIIDLEPIVTLAFDGSRIAAPGNYTRTGQVITRLASSLFPEGTAILVSYYTPGGTPYGGMDLTTYGSHDVQNITGSVFVRAIQAGPTNDRFTVSRLSMYDDPISWEFSVNGGSTWFDAKDIRNMASGVLTFPVPGKQLCYRLRAHSPQVSVSALAIRPWYGGILGTSASHQGNQVLGPNRSVQDQLPEIENDPMWQQWDQPIPKGWYFPVSYVQAVLPPSGSGLIGSSADQGVPVQASGGSPGPIPFQAVAADIIPTVTDAATFTITSSLGVNMLTPQESGFESSDIGGWQPTTLDTNVRQDTATWYTGAGSLLISQITPGIDAEAYVSRVFTAAVGQTHTLVANIQNVDTASSAFLVIQYLDVNGTSLLRSVQTLPVVTPLGWDATRYTLTATAPAGTAFVIPRLGVTSGSNTHLKRFDNVDFHRTT